MSQANVTVRAATSGDLDALAHIVVDAYESIRSTEIMFPHAQAYRAQHVALRRGQFAGELEQSDARAEAGERGARPSDATFPMASGLNEMHYLVAVADGIAVGFLRWSLTQVAVDAESADSVKKADEQIDAAVTMIGRLMGTDVEGGALPLPNFDRDTFARFTKLSRAAHVKACKYMGVHASLNTLAVTRSRQRQGIATQLMNAFLAQVDRLRLPAFLEATEYGLPLYRRTLFVPLDELTIASGRGEAFNLTIMTRTARPSEATVPL